MSSDHPTTTTNPSHSINSTRPIQSIAGSICQNQARQVNNHNAKSPLISLPRELLKVISYYLTDPLDLLRFSYTCKDVFYLTAPADWFSLANYTYPNWVESCGGADERNWKEIVLMDAALGVRLGAVLPVLPTISQPQIPSFTMTAPSPSSVLSAPVHPVNAAADALPTVTNSASSQVFKSQSATKLPSSLDEFDRRRPLMVKLSEARIFETDKETQNAEGAQWVRMSSPIYNIDRKTRTTVAASMITRPMSVPSKSVGSDPRPHEHEILFYSLPDLTNPIARCGSEIWEMDKANTSDPWFHPFTRDMMQVAQVVEIKHYPKTVVAGNMRVVIVIAFGQRAQPLINNATASHIIGVWLMLKVIEVWVPAYPQSILTKSLMNHFRADPSIDDIAVRKCVRINPDDVVNFESIQPRQTHTTMHGRYVKLYSADEPLSLAGGQKPEDMDVDAREKVDCIAIFGTQNSPMASAMVIKKVLFRDGPVYADLGSRTYSNLAVSRGVSCMALFPEFSGYEHLLVLFNQHGRGMVWDWVNQKHITQLHMSIDDKRKANPSPPPHRRFYYWGVQVSSDLELSFPDDLETDDNAKHNGVFRIVAMADSPDSTDPHKWESCWWNITREELLEPMDALVAPAIIDRNRSTSATPSTNPPKEPLIAKVTRFEDKTYGACLPEQERMHPEEHGRPIQLIAYALWNHYRISMSSRMGLCMVDLEEPESKSADKQWITFLKEREDLIDIAIFGHNLLMTLKTGHLVWSFYGQEKTSFVA
ncbi:hypothetical protein BGX30_002236 [Mortierella sp. GBA39]|nr:hypothetical protein BGX30_002236 [Mortierella sp. GBA39]